LIRSLARTLAVVVGTGFGTGYFPIAPGTVGSAAGIAIYALLVKLDAFASAVGWVAVLGAVFVAGVLAAAHLETRFGPDNRRIVVDEVWGMLVSLAFLPPSPGFAAAGFFLFRVFDIIKPFPGRRAERVGRGVGVMLDDGVAGLYACAVLHVARAVMGAGQA
jgi:phosphatidylglycerophosphatase A